MSKIIQYMRKLYQNTISHWLTHFKAGLKSLTRRGSVAKNNTTHGIDQPVVNSQTEKVPSIMDLLKQMSERQSLLTESLKKRKIGAELLHSIQNELIKEWKTKSLFPDSQSPEEDLVNITLAVARQLGLFSNAFGDTDLQFMLKIGWKMTQHNIGLSPNLEADDQYLAIKAELVKQLASVGNEKVNNATTAYLSFSFALNSGYLFSSYLLSNPKMKKPTQSNLSPSRIKATRDRGLELLLSFSQEVLEEIASK